MKRHLHTSDFSLLYRKTMGMVVLCMMCFLAPSLQANNLQLSDLRLEDSQTISFAVSWENSWHLDQGPANHDAVWVFVKGHRDELPWGTLALAAGGHQSSQPELVRIETVEDGLGVFLVPPQIGSRQDQEARITLQLDQPLIDGAWEIDILGIEMVWVPAGPYWLGDGASNFQLGYNAPSGMIEVTSEATLDVGNDPEFSSGNSVHPPEGLIPAGFPKGTEGFYCMKYELSQEQYVDFLNHLTLDQQVSRTVCGPLALPGTLAMATGNAFRNGIRMYRPATTNSPAVFGCDLDADGSFNEPEDGQTRACNFLSWDDLAAYLDWAGLSPMTELEFEKACRGPLPPVGGEFAWGTPEVIDANTVLLDGSDQETVAEIGTGQTGLASHGYDGPRGGLRCGFAAGPSTNRIEAGASYYGIMEMSGNLWEMCVVASSLGVDFRGENGDGILDDSGNGVWRSASEGSGGGYRGGAWNSGILPGFRDLAVSDRFYTGLNPDQRRETSGGRGVRR